MHPAHAAAAAARAAQIALLAAADAALVLAVVVAVDFSRLVAHQGWWSHGLNLLHGATQRACASGGGARQCAISAGTARRGVRQKAALHAPQGVCMRAQDGASYELTSLAAARDEAAARANDDDEAGALLPAHERAPGERAPGSQGSRLVRAAAKLRRMAQEEPLLVQTLAGASVTRCAFARARRAGRLRTRVTHWTLQALSSASCWGRSSTAPTAGLLPLRRASCWGYPESSSCARSSAWSYR